MDSFRQNEEFERATSGIRSGGVEATLEEVGDEGGDRSVRERGHSMTD